MSNFEVGHKVVGAGEKGVTSEVILTTRRAKAMDKHEKFVASHPEYA